MSRRSKNKAPQPQAATLPAATANPAPPGKWTVPGICILLAALVWAVFGQTLGHDFVNYDDDTIIYNNPAVAHGLTLKGIAWAFTHIQVGHWAPLTTISHMLDCRFFGLLPRGHHLANVLLHAAAAALLFLVLRQMTGALWRSAFVAAVFAVHPLRVESVAWVSERKDVLSGVFFMLTIAAYAHYTRKPQSLPRYLAALLLFALGLMSKSMLVTLPFVLLLLDYWPLGRFSSARRLVLEKIPFFALSAIFCAIQLVADQEGIVPIEKLSLPACIANALVSCVVYLWEMICPAGLAVLYPHPGNHLPVWEVLFAILLLASLSSAVVVLRHKHPFLLVGWLWYLGMLVPVSGLVQSGEQAHADRYTYLPQIGLYIAIAWMAADLCAAMPHRRMISGVAGSTVIAALIWCAWIQASYWQNSLSLWNRALAVTSNNAFAENSLGSALIVNGQVNEAIVDFQKAIEIKPDYADPHYNLGLALSNEGRLDAALEQYQKALEIKPGFAKAHNNLGNALLQKGRVDEAVAHYHKALEIDPGFAEAHNNLAAVLMRTGHVDEAITHYKKALEIQPDFADAENNLGNALRQNGEMTEAIAHYRRALEIQPGHAAALNNLAYLLAACPRASLRNGVQAVELAQQASQNTGGNNPIVLGTLAAAYAEEGRFSEAVDTAQRALDLAISRSDGARADALRTQISLYKTNKPFRDESLGK